MFSSDPVTMNPRSRNAAATDPIAVPQMPRKWKSRGAFGMRIPLGAEKRFGQSPCRLSRRICVNNAADQQCGNHDDKAFVVGNNNASTTRRQINVIVRRNGVLATIRCSELEGNERALLKMFS